MEVPRVCGLGDVVVNGYWLEVDDHDDASGIYLRHQYPVLPDDAIENARKLFKSLPSHVDRRGTKDTYPRNPRLLVVLGRGRKLFK